MSWIKDTFSSSVGRKLLMSLTGLFLIVFLLTHLAGNLSLLKNDNGASFNEYAHFMKHNPLIIIGEIVMFLGFIVHIIDGIGLVLKNRSARPIKYAYANKSKTQNWASKFMGPFGMILLVFLILHLVDFFAYKYTADLFGGIDMVNIKGEDIPDLAAKVYAKFQAPTLGIVYVIIYAISMLVVGFHLNHGFQSAFQTLGLNHTKYNGMIKGLGMLYSIVVPLLFALIPILIYFSCCGVGASCSHQ